MTTCGTSVASNAENYTPTTDTSTPPSGTISAIVPDYAGSFTSNAIHITDRASGTTCAVS